MLPCLLMLALARADEVLAHDLRLDPGPSARVVGQQQGVVQISAEGREWFVERHAGAAPDGIGLSDLTDVIIRNAGIRNGRFSGAGTLGGVRAGLVEGEREGRAIAGCAAVRGGSTYLLGTVAPLSEASQLIDRVGHVCASAVFVSPLRPAPSTTREDLGLFMPGTAMLATADLPTDPPALSFTDSKAGFVMMVVREPATALPDEVVFQQAMNAAGCDTSGFGEVTHGGARGWRLLCTREEGGGFTYADIRLVQAGGYAWSFTAVSREPNWAALSQWTDRALLGLQLKQD